MINSVNSSDFETTLIYNSKTACMQMTQICETTGRDGLAMISKNILFWLHRAYIFFPSELAMHKLFLFAWEASGYFFHIFQRPFSSKVKCFTPYYTNI